VFLQCFFRLIKPCKLWSFVLPLEKSLWMITIKVNTEFYSQKTTQYYVWQEILDCFSWHAVSQFCCQFLVGYHYHSSVANFWLAITITVLLPISGWLITFLDFKKYNFIFDCGEWNNLHRWSFFYPYFSGHYPLLCTNILHVFRFILKLRNLVDIDMSAFILLMLEICCNLELSLFKVIQRYCMIINFYDGPIPWFKFWYEYRPIVLVISIVNSCRHRLILWG